MLSRILTFLFNKCIIIEHMSNHHLINTGEFLEYWVNQIHSNDQYKDLSQTDVDKLSDNSRHFLQLFLQSSTSLTEIKASNLSPLMEFLRFVRKQHDQQGLSLRDTTLLTLSLKSSLSEFTKQSAELSHAFEPLRHTLDIFGILAFELYSNEQASILTQQSKQIEYLQNTESKAFGTLIGTSPAMQTVYQAIGLILENDATVLLQGESGTGKDVIANVIHTNSKRKSYPFVSVNCGAIPSNLIESELFGHEAGAFTGANHSRIGKFELANKGTVFLDEISELSLENQTKLLRIIQNKEVQPVGSNLTKPIDVRIIAASNRSLEDMVDAQQFRLDLFYRLHVFPIHVPPLSKRGDDIIQLTHHFIEEAAHNLGVATTTISDAAMDYLKHRPWKGNIRELQNLIQRAIIIANGRPITKEILTVTPGKPNATPFLLSPKTSDPMQSSFELKSLDLHEVDIIKKTLQLNNYNIKKTASILGISRTTLYNKCSKFNIKLA